MGRRTLRGRSGPWARAGGWQATFLLSSGGVSGSDCRYISQSGPAKCRPANQHGIAVARRALLRRRLYRMLIRTNSSLTSMAELQSAREDLHYELKIVPSAQV